MIRLTLVPTLLILASCASVKHDLPEDKARANARFKKEKPLTTTEVPSFYEGTSRSSNPALSDETMDRHTDEELSKVTNTTDPLIEVSIRCAKEDFKAAFAIASKHFDRYQKIPSYWNLIGNCHLNQGSPRKALLFYNKAIEVSPNYVPAMNNIGVLYSRQGEKQKALIAFEKANRQSKFSKTPRYNLAKLYLTYGLAEDALPIFDGLHTANPTDVDLINSVASCYFLKADYQMALTYYQKIPEAELSKPEIGLNYALTLSKLGKKEEARTVLAGVDDPKTTAFKRYQASVETQIGDGE